MTRVLSSILLSLFLLAVTGSARAEQEFRSRSTISIALTHPAPEHVMHGRTRVHANIARGDAAPGFELTRSDGTPMRLGALRGEWVMLWFVDRHEALDRELSPVAEALANADVRTVAVCYDKASALARRYRTELPFTLLADPTGDVTALYGLLDESEATRVQPGFVLIDPMGRVRMAQAGDELSHDEAAQRILMALGTN